MKRKILSIFLLLMVFSAIPAFAQSDVTVHATAQRFQYGLMIWRSDTAHIWVLTDAGRVFNFPASRYGRLTNRPVAGDPRYPINGFGKIWDNYASVRAAIGSATMSELGFDMRVVQWNNIYYLQQLDGMIYQINPNSTWARAPGMPMIPLPATITGFAVQPQSINPGGTVTVTWSLTNAASAKLEVWDTATNTVIDTIPALPASGLTQIAISPFIIGNAGIMLTRGDVSDTLPRAEIVVNVSRADHSAVVSAAFQQYENGFMIWRSDTNGVYVFSGTGGGFFSSFPVDFLQGLADNPFGSAPPNRVRPINGFGRVWGNVEWVRTALGWATAPEQAFTTMVVTAQGAPVSFTLPDGRTVSITPTNNWTLQ